MKTIHTPTDYTVKGYTQSDKEELKNREGQEKYSEQIHAKIATTTLNNILDRAKKEKRNKSEMVRVIIEESFEDDPINIGLLQSGKNSRKDN